MTKIILTGGGTAGHVWPLILVGQSLSKNKRASILYVGSRQGIERSLVKNYNIPFKGLFTGKKRNYWALANYWDYFKVVVGIIQSFFVLLFFRPDVILAKGGYVTVPIIFWLKFFKIPLVIHESDAVIGRANYWAGKFAKKICLGFPIENYQTNLPIEKLVHTGTPVSSEFLQTPIKDTEKLNLLIIGGSQGSEKINSIISEILSNLSKKYEIWHISGQTLFEKLSHANVPNYHLFKFSDEVPKLMRNADLVVSRAGANTLFEIAAAQKAAIIIPLPSAAANHQVANAKIFAQANAAVTLSEKNLSSSSLASIIDTLMQDQKLRSILGHHAHSFYEQDAVESIIAIMFQEIKCIS